MASGGFARVVACLLVFVVPGAMIAADTQAAMMYTSGPVMVNGTNVYRSAAIFSGDKVRVPVQSSVTITAKGSSVTVAPGSAITFQGDAIALEARSAVSITTTDLMTARIKTLTITPAGTTQTRFQVVRLNGHVTITASLGAVVVSDNEKKKGAAVPEGKTTTVPDPDAPSQLPPAAATIPPAAKASPAALAVLLGLGAAGGAVGVAMGTTGTPVSPVQRH